MLSHTGERPHKVLVNHLIALMLCVLHIVQCVDSYFLYNCYDALDGCSYRPVCIFSFWAIDCLHYIFYIMVQVKLVKLRPYYSPLIVCTKGAYKARFWRKCKGRWVDL